MLIDTHCHLDAQEFERDRPDVMRRARDVGVKHVIIPAVAPYNFQLVRDLAHDYEGGAYALGIHPICIPQAHSDDLEMLDQAIKHAMGDPRFIAVGEIGLDFFIPELKTPDMQRKQEEFYVAQLKLARKYGLPVILHVRRSQDRILKYLRNYPDIRGVAHAFNGSFQQAGHFLDLGFVLGAGGAMTFSRARQIRRLVSDLPINNWVLETDAPDIPPSWLHSEDGRSPRNEPAEVAGVARAFAELKDIPLEDVLRATSQNVKRVFPRLFS